MLKGDLPKTLPFSSDFIEYINKYRKETFSRFTETNKKIYEITENEKKQKVADKKAEDERLANERQARRDRRANELRIQKEREQLAREEKEKKKRKEISKINDLAISAGYSGYENQNIIRMIYETQEKGGLEKYLNQVVGCHALDQGPCEQWYPKLKAIQVLDNGVLYHYAEYTSGEYVSFTIFADKEPGKIYQEGQAFKNTFYVFKGMLSYATVTGATKTVPSFVKAKLKQ